MDVTVIIPCYNCENTIEETCNSIINQTFRPSKIILVNDGSKDNTLSILKEIKNNNKNIIEIIDKNNGGVSSARNCGIRNVNTTWIAFCDSDDLWLENKLEIINETVGNNEKVNFISHAYYNNKCQKENLVINEINNNPFLLCYNRNYIQTSTVVVKKQLLNEIGLFNEKLPVAEDFDLWLSCLARNNFLYIPIGLSIYRKERNGSLSSNELKIFTYTLFVFRKHINDLTRFMSYLEAKKYIRNRMLRLIVAELWYQIKISRFSSLKFVFFTGLNEIKKIGY